jgi:hypothetical protein
MLENFPTMTKEQADKVEIAKEVLVAIWPASVKIRDQYGGNDRAKISMIILSALGVFLEVTPNKMKEAWDNYKWNDEEATALAEALVQLAFNKKP